MKTPRIPKASDKLVSVAKLPRMQTLVKHVKPRITTFWIQHPSTNGQECQLVFLGKNTTNLQKWQGDDEMIQFAMRVTTRTA